MRRINVGYFYRAKFLATKSCIIAERKHQPHTRNFHLHDGEHAPPLIFARNPRQRAIALDQPALPHRTKCLAWTVSAPSHRIFRVEPFFHEEIVKEPDDCQSLL